MGVIEHVPGGPREPRGRRRFPFEAAIGILLLLVGAGMAVIGFAYALGEVTGWPKWLLSTGLFTFLAGAAIIEWRLAARFYGRGPVATGVVVLGGIVVAALFVLVALSGFMSI